MVAAGFLTYTRERDAESPAFDECPGRCDIYDQRRDDYCENCPIGIARNDYVESITAELDRIDADNKRPGRFGFEYLNECVLNALSAQTIPAELQTVQTARMLDIIEGERLRIKRVERWNKRQKTPNS